jgi:nitrogen fixation/metabolism regulation signal transduction histidine kinase
MKLRWRIVLALSLAGLLPLAPLLWVVHSSITLSADSLAPTKIGRALTSGIELTRTLLEIKEERLGLHLERFLRDIPLPSDERKPGIQLDTSLMLFVNENGNWYRLSDGQWKFGSPDIEFESSGFREFPTSIVVEDEHHGSQWRLEETIGDDLIESAKELQSIRADWTLRSLERDRLIGSVVITYAVVYVAAVLIAVASALLVVVPESRRIERLAKVMELVGEGDVQQRADEAGGGEVSQLAGSFNIMIERLELSRKKAADMEKMAGWRELARVLAHEIKNPLTPIQLSVQQISDSYDGDDERFSRLLITTREIVDEEIESLRKLVREFGDFARAPQLELSKHSPFELIEDLGAFYGSRVEIVEDDAPDSFVFDREKVKRALINLIDNALHEAGDHGSVRLTLGSDSDYVQFIVEDSGTGVEPDRREKIFEPYITGKKSGVGLGLPIVKSVGDEHGGFVAVDDSRELGGAKFILSLSAHLKQFDAAVT